MWDHSVQVTDPGMPSIFTVREAKIIGKAMNLIEAKVLNDRPILNCADDVERYLILRFAGLTQEQFHVLYLDNSYRLLACRTEFFGQPCCVKTDLRRIVLHALTLGAVHVAFAHNHPGDSPVPSEDDIQQMEFSENILAQLGIHLLDSFVVTSRGVISTKATCTPRTAEELRKRDWGAMLMRQSKITPAKPPKRVPTGGIFIDQYNAVKAENPESLLFYRMGDFYELFFEDAMIASRVLGIVLMWRGKHDRPKIPFCGVPVGPAADDWVKRLSGQGHRAAFYEPVAARPRPKPEAEPYLCAAR